MNIVNATPFKLVRCHLLNKPTDTKKGSRIAQFESFSSRMTVWSKKRALMKTDRYLSEDYPREVNKIRSTSKLRPILKEASKHTEYTSCISIKYDKLHFKGELYYYPLTICTSYQMLYTLNISLKGDLRGCCVSVAS